MRKTKKALASLAIAGMVLSMAPVSVFGATTDSTRLGGAGRVETAIAIAAEGWTAADSVIVVPADDANTVDALAAAPLAGQLNAPILLTYKDALDPQVQQKIKDLGAKNVYAVGALSADTVASLKAISGVTVTPLQGADRTETAAKVAAQLTSVKGTFVVAYDGKADALSAASFAAANGYSIVIENPDGTVPASEKVVAPVYTVGGQAVYTGATPLAGADRYATNDAVNNGLTFQYDKVYVANGESLVDALAGAPLAAQTKSPIVLADAAKAATGVNDNLTSASKVIALGGAGAVSDSVLGQVAYQAPATLSVESVSAINARTLQVKFNAPVDPDTVLNDDDNFLSGIVKVDSTDLSGDTGYEGEFDDTNSVLTVYNKTASQWTKDTNYVVTVSDVKNLDAKKVTKYAQVVKMAETTAPTVVKVESKTNSDTAATVTLEFSEPVELSSVKIDDEFVTAAPAANYENFTSKWTLTPSDALDANQSYSLEINGAKDLIGNAMENTYKTSFTVVKDTTKPVPTVSVTGENTFNVVFDKTMNTSAIGIANFKVTYKDADNNTVRVPLTAVPSFKSDKKTVKVTIDSSRVFVKDTDDERTLTVEIVDLKDNLGNVMADYEGTIDLERDIVKPTVLSVTQKPGDYDVLRVKFSEAVNVAGATIYVKGADDKDVLSADDTVITAGTPVLSDSTTNTYEVTLNKDIAKTGTYKLVFVQDTITDNALDANKMAAQVVSFNFTQESKTAPAIAAKFSDAGLTSTNKMFTVIFNQADVVSGYDDVTGAFKAGAAEDPANYTVDGKALPNGVTITLLNNNQTYAAGVTAKDGVKLDFTNVKDADLPSEMKDGGDLAVSVSGVKTEAGATLSYTTNKVVVADATAPKLDQAYITSNAAGGYTLTVYFNEEMSAVTATGIELDDTVGGTAVPTTGITLDGTDKTKATVDFAGTDLAGLDLTKLVLVVSGATGTKDAAAVQVANETGLDVSVYATVDTVAPVAGTPTAAAYDPATGILTLTTAGAEVGATVDVSLVTFTSTGTPFAAGSAGSFALTNSTGVVTAADTITITLSAEDKAELELETTLANIGVTTSNGLVVDAGNNVSADGAATLNGAATTVVGE